MLSKSSSGTVVGSNVKLTGTLQDIDNITIYGRVEGEVISEQNVFVGQTAVIKGPITAKVVTVTGKVRGNINASEKLEILHGGKVYGGITTLDLIINSGAIFVGKSTMRAKEEKEEVKGEQVSPV